MSNIKLSIIMPVFNAELYIKEAIESILNQTYQCFELIIIIDGATDKSEDIIRSYKNPRIKIIKNEQNRGIVYSRNRGFLASQGKYIGTFDADDIAYPTKFEEQVNFLEKNPDYGMLGTWGKIIDKNGNYLTQSWELTAPPEEIPAIMLFRNYFIQSAVVFRKECLNSINYLGYMNKFNVAEDYKLWMDINKDHKAWNLQKHLLSYRIHGQSAMRTRSSEVISCEKELHKLSFKSLHIEPTDYEIDLHLEIKNTERINNPKIFLDIEKWLIKLLSQNDKTGTFDKKLFTKIVFNRWLKTCFKARKYPITTLYRLLFSKLTQAYLGRLKLS